MPQFSGRAITCPARRTLIVTKVVAKRDPLPLQRTTNIAISNERVSLFCESLIQNFALTVNESTERKNSRTVLTSSSRASHVVMCEAPAY